MFTGPKLTIVIMNRNSNHTRHFMHIYFQMSSAEKFANPGKVVSLSTGVTVSSDSLPYKLQNKPSLSPNPKMDADRFELSMANTS